jgi:hypothetical protein
MTPHRQEHSVVDVLEKGSAWLNGQRHAHMSRPVVYERGADSVELRATVGRTVFEQVDEAAGGIIHKIESRDFLLLRSDLVLAGAPTLPKAGDRIRDSDGDGTQIYEVMAPGNEPPFRYSDPYRKTLRIHTKHIAAEAAGA